MSASLLAQTLAGSGGGFSTESIVVKLVSPDAPDLTVIDLPGIVRTATSGQANTVIDEVKMSADSISCFRHTQICAAIDSILGSKWRAFLFLIVAYC